MDAILGQTEEVTGFDKHANVVVMYMEKKPATQT